MDKMWLQYPELRGEIEAVQNIMKKSIRCRDKRIEGSLIELLNSSGKMLRPAFTLISSHFGNYSEDKARSLAAVMELLHMATLVHDDIVDDSKLRRGQETVQSKYGKDYAVYIGDFLFCVCFKLLAENSSLEAIKIDGKSMSRICIGEVEQLNSRFNHKTTVKEYLARISGKTAELFSLSLYIGAAESGCSYRDSRIFWNIGHNIGMAFQIIDDILDYSGSDEAIGKPAANDLSQGIFTLPLIYALRNDDGKLLKLVKQDSFNKEDIHRIISLVQEKGGVKKAQELAVRYTEKAFTLIEKLPNNPYKIILKDIANKLLIREY
ncbi:polyprenyl synthetase family protein [Alloiococcus sp. CFN-8]|uniref:polyprenyl synthetase family protein n=1 Tax=Alloiococcus sp. CFN-8 TaxID=3416081 RepID=UPI003CF8B54E